MQRWVRNGFTTGGAIDAVAVAGQLGQHGQLMLPDRWLGVAGATYERRGR